MVLGCLQLCVIYIYIYILYEYNIITFVPSAVIWVMVRKKNTRYGNNYNNDGANSFFSSAHTLYDVSYRNRDAMMYIIICKKLHETCHISQLNCSGVL